MNLIFLLSFLLLNFGSAFDFTTTVNETVFEPFDSVGFEPSFGSASFIDGYNESSAGQLYSYGGHDSNGPTDISWVLDLATQEVTQLPSLPYRTAGSSVVKLSESYRLLFGGETPDGSLTNALWISDDNHEWQQVQLDSAVQPYPRAYVSAAVLSQSNHSIVIAFIGGIGLSGEGLDECWILTVKYSDLGVTPSSFVWRKQSLPKTHNFPGRFQHTTSVVNSTLFIAGGRSTIHADPESTILTDIWQLNITDWSWIRSDDYSGVIPSSFSASPIVRWSKLFNNGEGMVLFRGESSAPYELIEETFNATEIMNSSYLGGLTLYSPEETTEDPFTCLEYDNDGELLYYELDNEEAPEGSVEVDCMYFYYNVEHTISYNATFDVIPTVFALSLMEEGVNSTPYYSVINTRVAVYFDDEFVEEIFEPGHLTTLRNLASVLYHPLDYFVLSGGYSIHPPPSTGDDDYNDDPYGSNDDPYYYTDDPYGNYDDPYGNYDDPYGSNDDPYGSNDDPYGNYDDPYGSNDDPYGSNDDPYASNDDPYASNDDPYGSNDDPYASNDDPYGGNDDPYGGSGDPDGYFRRRLSVVPRTSPPPLPSSVSDLISSRFHSAVVHRLSESLERLVRMKHIESVAKAISHAGGFINMTRPNTRPFQQFVRNTTRVPTVRPSSVPRPSRPARPSSFERPSRRPFNRVPTITASPSTTPSLSASVSASPAARRLQGAARRLQTGYANGRTGFDAWGGHRLLYGVSLVFPMTELIALPPSIEAPVPVDCQLSNFSAWSSCSNLALRYGGYCAENLQSRYRTILQEPENGGRACEALEESRSCGLLPCAKDLEPISDRRFDVSADPLFEPEFAFGSVTVVPLQSTDSDMSREDERLLVAVAETTSFRRESSVRAEAYEFPFRALLEIVNDDPSSLAHFDGTPQMVAHSALLISPLSPQGSDPELTYIPVSGSARDDSALPSVGFFVHPADTLPPSSWQVNESASFRLVVAGAEDAAVFAAADATEAPTPASLLELFNGPAVLHSHQLSSVVVAAPVFKGSRLHVNSTGPLMASVALLSQLMPPLGEEFSLDALGDGAQLLDVSLDSNETYASWEIVRLDSVQLTLNVTQMLTPVFNYSSEFFDEFGTYFSHNLVDDVLLPFSFALPVWSISLHAEEGVAAVSHVLQGPSGATVFLSVNGRSLFVRDSVSPAMELFYNISDADFVGSVVLHFDATGQLQRATAMESLFASHARRAGAVAVVVARTLPNAMAYHHTIFPESTESLPIFHHSTNLTEVGITSVVSVFNGTGHFVAASSFEEFTSDSGVLFESLTIVDDGAESGKLRITLAGSHWGVNSLTGLPFYEVERPLSVNISSDCLNETDLQLLGTYYDDEECAVRNGTVSPSNTPSPSSSPSSSPSGSSTYTTSHTFTGTSSSTGTFTTSHTFTSSSSSTGTYTTSHTFTSSSSSSSTSSSSATSSSSSTFTTSYTFSASPSPSASMTTSFTEAVSASPDAGRRRILFTSDEEIQDHGDIPLPEGGCVNYDPALCPLVLHESYNTSNCSLACDVYTVITPVWEPVLDFAPENRTALVLELQLDLSSTHSLAPGDLAPLIETWSLEVLVLDLSESGVNLVDNFVRPIVAVNGSELIVYASFAIPESLPTAVLTMGGSERSRTLIRSVDESPSNSFILSIDRMDTTISGALVAAQQLQEPIQLLAGHNSLSYLTLSQSSSGRRLSEEFEPIFSPWNEPIWRSLFLYPLSTPVDCVISEWSGWGPCSLNCVNGLRTRTRTLLVPPANGGACPTDPAYFSETVPGLCGLGACFDPLLIASLPAVRVASLLLPEGTPHALDGRPIEELAQVPLLFALIESVSLVDATLNTTQPQDPNEPLVANGALFVEQMLVSVFNSSAFVRLGGRHAASSLPLPLPGASLVQPPFSFDYDPDAFNVSWDALGFDLFDETTSSLQGAIVDAQLLSSGKLVLNGMGSLLHTADVVSLYNETTDSFEQVQVLLATQSIALDSVSLPLEAEFWESLSSDSMDFTVDSLHAYVRLQEPLFDEESNTTSYPLQSVPLDLGHSLTHYAQDSTHTMSYAAANVPLGLFFELHSAATEPKELFPGVSYPDAFFNASVVSIFESRDNFLETRFILSGVSLDEFAHRTVQSVDNGSDEIRSLGVDAEVLSFARVSEDVLAVFVEIERLENLDDFESPFYVELLAEHLPLKAAAEDNGRRLHNGRVVEPLNNNRGLQGYDASWIYDRYQSVGHIELPPLQPSQRAVVVLYLSIGEGRILNYMPLLPSSPWSFVAIPVDVGDRAYLGAPESVIFAFTYPCAFLHDPSQFNVTGLPVSEACSFVYNLTLSLVSIAEWDSSVHSYSVELLAVTAPMVEHMVQSNGVLAVANSLAPNNTIAIFDSRTYSGEALEPVDITTLSEVDGRPVLRLTDLVLVPAVLNATLQPVHASADGSADEVNGVLLFSVLLGAASADGEVDSALLRLPLPLASCFASSLDEASVPCATCSQARPDECHSCHEGHIFDENLHICIQPFSCAEGELLVESSGECVPVGECPSGTFEDLEAGICSDCYPGCSSCFSNEFDSCLSCSTVWVLPPSDPYSGYYGYTDEVEVPAVLLDGRCVGVYECPAGFMGCPAAGSCIPDSAFCACHVTCLTCDSSRTEEGFGDQACNTCSLPNSVLIPDMYSTERPLAGFCGTYDDCEYQGGQVTESTPEELLMGQHPFYCYFDGCSLDPSLCPSPSPSPSVSASPSASTSPAPVVRDCELSDWSDWSDCSTKCYIDPYSAWTSRVREILQPDANGGLPCPHEYSEERLEVAACDCSGSEIPNPPLCANNVRDGSESDIDCGGYGVAVSAGGDSYYYYDEPVSSPPCVRCGAGRRCHTNDDCESLPTSGQLSLFHKISYTGPAFICATDAVPEGLGSRRLSSIKRKSRVHARKLNDDPYSPGDDPYYFPPGDDPYYFPPGDDPYYVPPGDDPYYVPPGDDYYSDDVVPTDGICMDARLIDTTYDYAPVSPLFLRFTFSLDGVPVAISVPRGVSSLTRSLRRALVNLTSLTPPLDEFMTHYVAPVAIVPPVLDPPATATRSASATRTPWFTASPTPSRTPSRSRTPSPDSRRVLQAFKPAGHASKGARILADTFVESWSSTITLSVPLPNSEAGRDAFAAVISGADASAFFASVQTLFRDDLLFDGLLTPDAAALISVNSFLTPEDAFSAAVVGPSSISGQIFPSSTPSATPSFSSSPSPSVSSSHSASPSRPASPVPPSPQVTVAYTPIFTPVVTVVSEPEIVSGGGGSSAGPLAGLAIVIVSVALALLVGFVLSRRNGSLFGCAVLPFATCGGRLPLKPEAMARYNRFLRRDKNFETVSKNAAPGVYSASNRHLFPLHAGKPTGKPLSSKPMNSHARNTYGAIAPIYKSSLSAQSPRAVLNALGGQSDVELSKETVFQNPLLNPLAGVQPAHTAAVPAASATLAATASQYNVQNPLLRAGAHTAVKMEEPVRKAARPAKKPMTEAEAALVLQRVWKGAKLRRALSGWVKVIDDDGDVFYRNVYTGILEWLLPPMPFQPASETSIAVDSTSVGQAQDAEDAHKDFVVGEDGLTYFLDNTGKRLAHGWKECDDGEDVWYVNDDLGESSWIPIYADEKDNVEFQKQTAEV